MIYYNSKLPCGLVFVAKKTKQHSLCLRVLLFLCLFVVCFFHLTFDVESCHLRYTISADGDGFLEMAGELALAIIGHRDHAFLSRLDRSLAEQR